MAWTKEERREYNRKYFVENAEKEKARRAKYYVENAEKAKAGKAKYRAENAEKIKARDAKYYVENAEKTKARIAKDIAGLKDGYVKDKLRRQGFKNEQITPELIELKRITLKTTRLCRQLSN